MIKIVFLFLIKIHLIKVETFFFTMTYSSSSRCTDYHKLFVFDRVLFHTFFSLYTSSNDHFFFFFSYYFYQSTPFHQYDDNNNDDGD